ncbi:complement component C1q receptor [Silurus asotus]|uniref:Complement component C1q receptor n=1 Tax=Silurus asotus TaxID=30991 RepID=A0AAD5AJ44_SILAS|nr:complement component C1q receptor [Silurus asotus]
MMICALIAVLCALLAAERATSVTTTKCTSTACFTLYKQLETFERANAKCYENGGYVIAIRDNDDLEAVKSLLALDGYISVQGKVWIGLKLSKGNCVLSDETLHGFRWISGAPKSFYSNWRREPRSTCTEDRCVSLNTSTPDLKWSDRSCKERAHYICVYYFSGMCKPLLLAGPGEVYYSLPFLNGPLQQDGGLDMLPYATFAEISCASGVDGNTYTVCKRRDAHYFWENHGPFCASGKRSCDQRNGGCHQLCVDDDDGGVHCECKEDYYLGDDRVTCLLKDVCFGSPCDHQCVPNPLGFSCACENGFELSEDKVSCKDVDECTLDVCKGHICHNNRGGFECECKKGFVEVGGVCEDVDECAEQVCPPHTTCLNSEGSFSCDCSSGFRMNGELCVDVDECLNRPCEGLCRNTDGSYRCACGPGFILAENGIRCVPEQKHTTTSDYLDMISTRGLDQEADTTVSTETTAGPHQRVRKEGLVVGSWVLVYALCSIIPLLLLITLTAVIAVYRCNRSRKDSKKTSVTADSYCWVSSEYTAQLETQPNRIY